MAEKAKGLSFTTIEKRHVVHQKLKQLDLNPFSKTPKIRSRIHGKKFEVQAK
jgi:hypothetical protein